MQRTTITLHVMNTPEHGMIRYARVFLSHGRMTIGQTLMLHRLRSEYRELIEPGSLGFCPL